MRDARGDDRSLVHSVIYDELCRGIISDSSRTAYLDVIQRLADSGAEGVILGCTEVELLISQDDTPSGLPHHTPACGSRCQPSSRGCPVYRLRPLWVGTLEVSALDGVSE
ncbi:hypothetical protein GCM10009554_50720 [Kribbella koreensis]|uniref:Aspartate racemase n=1 Tax=Kribbella koreensis TaxID=57909 RepID=A0ABP4BG52_9ACTN